MNLRCLAATLLPVLTLTAGCATSAASQLTANELKPQQQAVASVLNDWHLAAAEADATRYFGHFTADAVFIGTDATERWDLAAFRAFAMPYFERGKAWTYSATGRHVMLSPSGRSAWFDEQLHNAKYGQVRGSGVLLYQAGRWRIAHYVMSFPIPNKVAAKVIELAQSPSAVMP